MRRVALLRGINVGGHRKVPMADLRTMAGDAGFTNVATYIQSGNLFFDGDADDTSGEVAVRLRDAIAATFGFDIDVMVRTLAEVQKAAAACPFAPPGADEPQAHIGFLGATPGASAIAQLKPTLVDGEAFTVIGQELHLFLPNGSARSKLASYDFARVLGTGVTVRNWRTVNALIERLQPSQE